MKPILDSFSESYFTLPIMMICQITASLVGYHHRNKFVELKYFHWYPIASFFQVIVFLISLNWPNAKMARIFMEASINLFVFLEVPLIYIILRNVLTIIRLKLILKFALIAFFAYSIAIFAFTNAFLRNSSMITVDESFMILIAVFLYLIQLFKLPFSHNVFGQPAFWISIGILFAFGCTLPLTILDFFAQRYISVNPYLWNINFIGYSILFLFVTKGYLCRKEKYFSNDSDYALIENFGI